MHKVRTFKDGKLKIADDGLLLHDKDMISVTGDVRNSWAGVSTLQALFIKEHNAVCDALKVLIINELLIYKPSIRCHIINEYIKTLILVFMMFQREYRHMSDEQLYHRARLVTSAVIAKIHTIDWTVELLKTDTLLAGMRANW